jgi:hypothetical protein
LDIRSGGGTEDEKSTSSVNATESHNILKTQRFSKRR